MKKFTAFLLALVMVFTFVAITACNDQVTVRLVLDPGGDNPTRQYAHVVGKDDLPGVTNGDMVFGGWYYDKELTKPFVVEDDQTEDGMMLYAKWRLAGQVENKIILTLSPNYEGASVTVSQLDKGSTFTLPKITREGYTLDGWFTEPAGGLEWSDDLALTVDTALYAHWTENPKEPPLEKFALTLLTNYEGGTAALYYVEKGTKFSLTDPTDRDGYTFDGWYTLPTGGVKLADVTVTEDTFVYAHWTANNQVVEQYIVTLCYNYEGAAVVNEKVNKNATFTLPTPSRSGYDFDGWYNAATGGTKFIDKIAVSGDTILYAHWTANGQVDVPTHEHNFGDNYFIYVTCSVEGCDVIGRNESKYPFRDTFTYSFTQTDRDAIDLAYNALKAQIKAGTVSVETISDAVDSFEEAFLNVQYQYQVATVLFSVNYDDEWEEKATLVGNAYNDCMQYYFTLFGLIDESSYRDAYFADWDPDDKEYCLAMAEIYSTEDNLQNTADELANNYNDKFNELYYSESEEIDWSPLYELYYDYVQANNNIAKQNKYSNYMDYAYANEYGREYTPAQVATMRNYVKNVIAPILLNLYAKYAAMDGFFDSETQEFYDGMEDAYYFYEALVFDSLFTLDEGYEQGTYDATNYIGNYFKYLNNNQTGDTEINFYKEVNKVFQNGNYFTGPEGEDGAYTYYIRAKQTPIMYFNDTNDAYYGYSYSTAFTFVHEFGHYYADIYTGGGDYSMDHAETHSQGDEMMFLAWLKDNCPEGAEYGYEVLQVAQLFDILCTVVQATIVDEFEQAVYSDTYGNGEFKNGIEYSKYGDLYKAILDSYGEGMSELLGEEYWMYVVVDSSAYYISYAMSALPSVELYVEAMTDGLDAARAKYFKLFTFADEGSNADANNDGEVTYSEALDYAGLANPFNQAMYTKIQAYFATLLQQS